MSRARKPQSDLSPAELEKQIELGRIERLYLFVGVETYLKKRALDQLAGTIDAGFRNFNINYYSLNEVSLAEALDTARQFPMMAQRRLIVISDLDKIDEAAIDPLIDYLNHPVDSACVVFSGATLDGRRRYAQTMQSACVVVNFEPLDERVAGGWATKYLDAYGVKIEPSALGLLIGLTGGNMMHLSNELEKLITYVGQGKRITLPDVEALVPSTKVYTNFQLGDALIAGERQKSLRLLRRLLVDGGEPVAILGMLAWAYRRLLIAKEMTQLNASMQDICREAKVYPGAHDFFAQVRRADMNRISKGIRRIAEVDIALKTSAGTPRMQLEHLICELTGK